MADRFTRFFSWLWWRIQRYPIRFKEMLSQLLNLFVVAKIADLDVNELAAWNVFIALAVAFFTEGMSVSTVNVDEKIDKLSDVKAEVKAQERIKFITDPGNSHMIPRQEGGE